ncbi:MAG: seryl-tRNA synthetase [Alteromonas naphthalenivorans]|jgi:seryl-tRNA synthetase
MIDMSLLRHDPEGIGAQIQKKDPRFNIKVLLEVDAQVRDINTHVETLRSKKNELAKQAKSGVTPELREQSIAVGKELKEKETQLEQVQISLNELLYTCPNMPLADVPEGNKEENQVVKEVGKKPTFSFTPKHHVELDEKNKWFDFEAGANLAASGFVWYQGQGVKLLYALAMFMLKSNSKHGFEVVLPPYFANEKTLTVSGNFPKFKDEVFAVTEDNLYAIPTSEVSLVNKYRGAIIPTDQLPINMTAWSSCFRREAGNYGANERGLIRIHQFEKVELVTLCESKNSEEELKRMMACAEDILSQLGLHYRVSLLAAQDCSFQSAKTYDIEVWLPGQERYYEVSSASICTDFQARRGKIRHRKSQGEKTELVHTLNASSLALPRLMVALIETYQQEDGSIKFPEVLKKEMF